MAYLDMTRDAAKARINSTNPAPIDNITLGAAIMREASTGRQILLLKRNADKAYYPDVFELPRGKVDDTDNTILESLIRDVAEETHLVVSRIVSALPVIRYRAEKVTQNTIARSYSIVQHAV